MNSNQGTMYNVVFPLAKKDEYSPNDTIDFVISLENKKLVPNSLVICGDAAVYKRDLLSHVISSSIEF